MFKKGFTLAEVLIALGIVGVIAAISIPTFVSNTQNQANASKLAAVVSDLETAFTSMMAFEGVQEFEETSFYVKYKEENNYTEASNILGNYYKLLDSTNKTTDFYDNFRFGYISGGNGYFSWNHLLQTKNGALLIFSKSNYTITEEKAEQNGISVTRAPLTLSIDVNGKEKPNMMGRDYFTYLIGNDGSLYPWGSKVVSILHGGNTNNTWKNASGSYPCTNEMKKAGCTARLAENGYKVDY